MQEESRTKLLIQPSIAYEKDGDLESKIRFSYRLRLPRIEKRLNLIVSGNLEDDYDVNSASLEVEKASQDSELVNRLKDREQQLILEVLKAGNGSRK